MLATLVLIPLLLAVIAVLLPSERLRPWLLPLGGTLHLLFYAVLFSSGKFPSGRWFAADPLGLLVLGVVSVLFCACSFYAVGYLHYRIDRGSRLMVPVLFLFLAAATLVAFVRHYGLLWVVIETSTLGSAPLIYYNRNARSIEATWKYLLLCSVGIALAMLGLMFVAYAAVHGGGPATLHLDELMAGADRLSRPWLHAGFVFLLVGFGTKMGLAPLHSWKPDAYGEAPGLVGAILAGALTSVAFLGILRAMQLLAATGDLALARSALIALGVCSLLVATVCMVRQPDIKRLLAYSSVEHMGILALGVGVGKLAAFGAFYHLLNNALTKGVLFLSAGNLHRAYASKHLEDVRGGLRRVPVSAALLLTGFLAVTGTPPFGPFMSELTILRGLFGGGHPWLGALLLSCLAIIFIGMAATVLGMVQGGSGSEGDAADPGDYRDTPLMVGPPLLLLCGVLLLGLWLPEPLRLLLEQAAASLEVRP